MKVLDLLPHDELRVEGDPYMRRYWLVKTLWFQVRLHHILRSDRARHLHDHPWPFVSVGLRGAYTEHRAPVIGPVGFIDRTRSVRAPWLMFRRRRDRHRLVLAAPVWTLILTGRVKRDDEGRAVWGFATETGWVPWWLYADDIYPPGVKS